MKSNTITMMTNGVMTGTNTVTSNAIPLDQIYGFAIQIVSSGTAEGAVKLQASCDAPARQTQVSNGGPDEITDWTDIADSSILIVTGDNNIMYNYNGCFYRAVRVVYTNTTGSGLMSAKLSVKGV